MKLSGKILSLAALASSLYITGCANIGVGNVGIEVSKVGKSRGVQDVTVETGFVVYNPFTTSIIEYPYYVQTVKWTKSLDEGKPIDESITFTTSDSAVVSCDVASSIQLDYNKAPQFYVQYRADDINTFVDGFYRNVVRNELNDVAGSYTVEQIMGNNGPMIKAVENAVQAKMTPIGIQVTNLGFIGACRPPEVVTNSINAKLAQQQRALQTQNEIAQAEAEAKKKEAEAQGIAQSNIIMAQADATANKLRSESITPQILQWEAIHKWNGQRPQVEGSNGSILLNVK